MQHSLGGVLSEEELFRDMIYQEGLFFTECESRPKRHYAWSMEHGGEAGDQHFLLLLSV